MSASDARTHGQTAGAGERRPITVLFADLVGSTSIAERLDPEDWTTLVGEAFGCMNQTVERYGETVARLMGDGVLAFFGAPVAHKDDPERAVRCGLDMVHSIDELSSSQPVLGPGVLRVRVGINTGPVVVGSVGTSRRTSTRPWATRSTSPHGCRGRRARAACSSHRPRTASCLHWSRRKTSACWTSRERRTPCVATRLRVSRPARSAHAAWPVCGPR